MNDRVRPSAVKWRAASSSPNNAATKVSLNGSNLCEGLRNDQGITADLILADGSDGSGNRKPNRQSLRIYENDGNDLIKDVWLLESDTHAKRATVATPRQSAEPLPTTSDQAMT